MLEDGTLPATSYFFRVGGGAVGVSPVLERGDDVLVGPDGPLARGPDPGRGERACPAATERPGAGLASRPSWPLAIPLRVAAGLPLGLSELTAGFKAGVLALFRAAKTTDTALTIGDMTQSLLTAEQVAMLLGVPRSWVYEQSRTGRIPTVRLGRYRRYRREAIEAWLEELEAEGVDGGRRRRAA